MRRALALLGTLLWVAVPAAAQGRPVIYDSVSGTEAPATIECGFCAGEKYGVVFRELSSPARPGLRASEFPLRLDSIMVAVASVNVGFDLDTGGTTCTAAGGLSTVSMMIEAFAGPTAPTGSIPNDPDHPMSGPWIGETMIFGQSADLQLSVEQPPAGSMRYDIMVNTVTIDMGVAVLAPNTYIRVVVTIPDGGTSTSSDTCTVLEEQPPGAVGLIDGDGPIESEIDFIYANGAEIPIPGLETIPEGWHWNEEVTDAEHPMGIYGDWLIRLNVTPMGTTGTDAGVPTPDGGTAFDAGMTSMMDSGTAQPDAGSTSSMCGADAECAGGERCVEGMCRRVSCTAASDCAGGMTCVEGMCRNLCSSNAECNGGEVCDDTSGYCVPVTTMDGGCGCRAAGGSRGAPLAFVLAGVVGLVLRRRRQLARRV